MNSVGRAVYALYEGLHKDRRDYFNRRCVVCLKPLSLSDATSGKAVAVDDYFYRCATCKPLANKQSPTEEE